MSVSTHVAGTCRDEFIDEPQILTVVKNAATSLSEKELGTGTTCTGLKNFTFVDTDLDPFSLQILTIRNLSIADIIAYLIMTSS